MAAILAASMMLNHLDQPEAAASAREAILAVLSEGKILTADLGGSRTTNQATQAILFRLN